MNIRLAKGKTLGLSTIIWYCNLIAFFTTALVFRSIDLENTPGVNGDEAYYGDQAECLISGRPFPKLTPSGQLINPFYVGIEAALLHFFAPSIAILRIPALIAGVLVVVLTYFLGRRVFGEATASSAAILLASSPTAIAISRFGWVPSWTPLFSLLALISAMAGRQFSFFLLMLLNLNVHFTNVFLIPTLLPTLFIAGVAKQRRDGKSIAEFVATTLLGIIGLCLLTWFFVSPTLSPMKKRPFLSERMNPANVYLFIVRLGRMISGVSTYRHIAGEMTARSVWVHDAGFWGLLALLLIIGLRRLVRSRRWENIALISGIVLGSITLYAVGGISALSPGFERYGTFLIVPAAFSASILLCAAFLECGGSLVSRRRRRLLAFASLFGWMMLYDFHQNYLQPIWSTGGRGHRTFRTAAIEPKKQALSLILEDLSAASGSNSARKTVIVAEDWWIYAPLNYLASPRSDISVDLLRRFLKEDRFKSLMGEAYFVGFINGPIEKLVQSSGVAPLWKRWTVNDRSGRPLLRIFRLAEGPKPHLGVAPRDPPGPSSTPEGQLRLGAEGRAATLELDSLAQCQDKSRCASDNDRKRRLPSDLLMQLRRLPSDLLFQLTTRDYST
jgi:hypothetical protein